MPDTQRDLAALIGSRICHDLISPLGAIGNGVELLALSGAPEGPEIALISESVANANARIRFFRVAFGAAAPGQQIGRAEILSILADITRGGKIAIDWTVPGEVARQEVRLAFLLLQCFETALPYGGRVRVEMAEGRWRLQAEAEQMKIDPPVWELLVAGAPSVEVTPAQVHFALVPDAVQRLGRALRAELGETRITLSF